MSLYKPAKSRFWHFDFQFRGKRYHGSTGCTSKRDADRYQSEIRRKAALGDEVKPTISVLDACNAWFEAKGQFQSSAPTVRYQLVNLAQGLGVSTLLADISLASIDKYIAVRRASVSNASVNRETALLRRVINWCQARTFDTPSIDWKEAKLKEAAVQTRTLSPAEQKRLFEHLPESLMPIVEFALLSGQRKAEIVSLLWSGVDLINMRAKVRAKGDKMHSFPLTPRMAAIIEAQPKVCAQVFTYVAERDGPPREDRVRRKKGERYPFSKQGWDRKWRKALKDASIEDYRFHDNRHTAATRSGRIEVAYQLLGHSDIRTTKRYFHTAEDEVRQALIAAESRIITEPLHKGNKNARKS